MSGRTSDFVKVNISNSKNDSIAYEIKFAKDITISELRSKLEMITGGNAGTMKLELYKGGRLISTLANKEAKLGFYIDGDGLRLHVVDNFITIDDESVQKYELSKEQYEQKTNTVQSFLKMNKLGKYNQEELQKKAKRREQTEEATRRASLCVLDSRCRVTVPGSPVRKGTIKYNGVLEGKSDIYIGVQYDEPLGKNNGSIGDRKYFDCPPKYGSFVSPLCVEVGDFPPEAFNLDDEL